MDTLLKADIFFVVTTVAVFLVTIVAIWVMIYLVEILRNVKDISETVKYETKKLSQDIDAVRNHVSTGGMLPDFLKRWMKGSRRTGKNKK